MMRRCKMKRDYRLTAPEEDIMKYGKKLPKVKSLLKEKKCDDEDFDY